MLLDIAPIFGSPSSIQVEVGPSLQILEKGQEPQDGRSVFRILHQQFGDQRITWDNRSLTEINEAKGLFVDLIKQGLTPYRVGTNGQRTSEVMKEFDPKAEEVIFIPTRLVAGG